MFLKRESPETDYFVIQKISGCWGKVFQEITINCLQGLADTFTNISKK